MGFDLLLFNYFKKRLDPLIDLPKEEESAPYEYKLGWNGFSSRWQVPAKLMNPQVTSIATSTILMVLDTKREADIGMGPNFSKTEVMKDQMMVSESAMRYLGKKVGQKIRLYMQFETPDLIKGATPQDIVTETQSSLSVATPETKMLNDYLSLFFKSRD